MIIAATANESSIDGEIINGNAKFVCLPFMIPPSMLDSLAVAAMINYNLSPTSSNVNNVPPMVLVKGQSIDYSKFCISSFGEIVYATENNGYEMSS